MWKELPTRFYFPLLIACLVGNIYVYSMLLTSQKLAVHVLAHEKGIASLLVQESTGDTLLINTGKDASILRDIGSKLPPWKRTLDALFLTDTNGPAATNLPIILDRYPTGIVLYPATTKHTTEAAIDAILAGKGVRKVVFESGTILQLGDGSTISTRVYPAEIDITYGDAALQITENTPRGVFSSDGTSFSFAED